MNYLLYILGFFALVYSLYYLAMAQSAIHEICASLNFLIFILCFALGHIIQIGNKIYRSLDNTPKEPNKYFKPIWELPPEERGKRVIIILIILIIVSLILFSINNM